MSLSKQTLNALIAGAFAVTLAGVSSHPAFAEDEVATEKCYGVVRAGHNDCGNKFTDQNCAGSAKVDGAGGDFVAVPKGLCEKLVGGMLEPTEKPGTTPPDAKAE